MKKYTLLIIASINISLHICLIMSAAEQSISHYASEYAQSAENNLPARAHNNNFLTQDETALTKELTKVLTPFITSREIKDLIKQYAKKKIWRPQTIPIHQPVFTLAVAPDGESIAVGMLKGGLKLVDPERGISILEYNGHTSDIVSLDFSYDSSLLASGSSDTTVKIWNVYTGKLKQNLSHLTPVHQIKLLSDTLISRLLNTIELWDIKTYKKIAGKSLPGIHHFTTTSDEKLLAATSPKNNCIHILNAHTLEHIRTIPTDPIEGNIYCIAFSPTNNTQLAMGMSKLFSTGNAIKYMNLDSDEPPQILRGKSNIACALAYSSTGLSLASGGRDRKIKIWNLCNNQLYTTLKIHSNLTWSLAFSPDDNFLVSGSLDGTIQISDTSEYAKKSEDKTDVASEEKDIAVEEKMALSLNPKKNKRKGCCIS